ncbi:MAG: YjbQ family protein [Chloroflexi bacterium]|nr:YjbQ family protein [Chloroflexota bacterium]
MQHLAIDTHAKDEILDITAAVAETIRGDGMCTVFAAHTTCAITTADLDPGTDRDYIEAFRKLLPAIHFRHPHDPAHTPDHILATMIGPSVSVPVQSGRLLLGVWQRIILVEFDGPRRRDVYVRLS